MSETDTVIVPSKIDRKIRVTPSKLPVTHPSAVGRLNPNLNWRQQELARLAAQRRPASPTYDHGRPRSFSDIEESDQTQAGYITPPRQADTSMQPSTSGTSGAHVTPQRPNIVQRVRNFRPNVVGRIRNLLPGRNRGGQNQGGQNQGGQNPGAQNPDGQQEEEEEEEEEEE